MQNVFEFDQKVGLKITHDIADLYESQALLERSPTEYYYQADVFGPNDPRTPTDTFPFMIQFYPDMDAICRESIEFQTDAAFIGTIFNL